MYVAVLENCRRVWFSVEDVWTLDGQLNDNLLSTGTWKRRDQWRDIDASQHAAGRESSSEMIKTTLVLNHIPDQCVLSFKRAPCHHCSVYNQVRSLCVPWHLFLLAPKGNPSVCPEGFSHYTTSVSVRSSERSLSLVLTFHWWVIIMKSFSFMGNNIKKEKKSKSWFTRSWHQPPYWDPVKKPSVNKVFTRVEHPKSS